MADRKEWKEQLLSKLLDQYEKSVTYAGENKVKQVFLVKPSDIFKGYNNDSDHGSWRAPGETGGERSAAGGRAEHGRKS